MLTNFKFSENLKKTAIVAAALLVVGAVLVVVLGAGLDASLSSAKSVLRNILAMVVALAFLFLFFAKRFKAIGGVKVATIATVTSLVNVFVAFAAASASTVKLGGEFLMVAFLLLALSFANTASVYEKVADNVVKMPAKTSKPEVVNKSVGEVFAKNALSSGVMVLSVIALEVVAEVLKTAAFRGMAISLVVGILFSLFATTFLSAPIWAVWNCKKNKKKTSKYGKKK